MSRQGTRPLHVGLYAPALPSKGLSNGIVTYVGIMREALRALGHQVTIVDTENIEFSDGTIADLPTSRGLLCRVQMLNEAWRGRDNSTAYVRLRLLCAFDALKAAGAEIFEIEETWGWASRLVGRGIPVVMRLHGPHALAREAVERTRTDSRREAAELLAFGKVQAVTSPSASVLQAIVAQGGKASLARVIHNPVRVPGNQWSLGRADANQILFVGRFDLLKGADIVVRAFADAVEQRPSLKLVMVGPDRGLGGTVHFEEFVQSIPAKARSSIEFLGEQKPERVAQLRLQSALAIVSSRYETFPYTAFEAQALGMPLLMTDTLGPRGIVSDGIDGRLVPVADPASMAQTIIEMIDDPASLTRLGAAGRAMVANNMDPAHIARATARLYTEVLHRESSRSAKAEGKP